MHVQTTAGPNIAWEAWEEEPQHSSTMKKDQRRYAAANSKTGSATTTCSTCTSTPVHNT
jgi:hypothetical protein